jgi:hypothetical protein
MTDSLERFLQDLHFDVPSGLVDRAKAAVLDAPEHEAGKLGQTSGSVATTQPLLPDRRADRDWPMGRRTELLAGIAAAVLALIVIGTFAYVRGVATPRPAVPTLPDLTIKQYQALIASDEQATTNNFLNYQCTVNPPESSACAGEAAASIDRLQQYFSDLNESRPPARFTAIDGRLRRHLGLAMADLRAVIAANRAGDVSGAATALTAAMNERDTLNREASAIIFSSQETPSGYVGIVSTGKSNLLACDLCQKLVSQTSVSCQSTQGPGCADELAATTLQVETLLDSLVRGFAPDSLAAKGQLLQGDLEGADIALQEMSSGVSGGDQAMGRPLAELRQALSLVNRDAADIAGAG